MNAAQRQTAESGLAMMTVILVMIITSLLVGAVLLSANAQNDLARQSMRESSGRVEADSGLAVVMQALNARRMGEHDGWTLTEADALSLVSTTCDCSPTVVQNGSLYGRLGYVDLDRVPLGSRFALRTRPGGTGPYRFWQIVAIVPPDWMPTGPTAGTVGSRLVVYVRGWTSSRVDGYAKSTFIARGSFRPGRFSDLQMVVDGPISLKASGTDSFTVDGPIHSNGFPDRFLLDSNSTVGDQITVTGGLCTAKARFSTTDRRPTSAGTINLDGGCSGANKQQNIKDSFSVRSIEEVASWIRTNLCSSPTSGGTAATGFSATCTTAPAPGTVIDIASLATADSSVVVYNDSVSIKGTLPDKKRLSIFAISPSNASGRPAASIRLVGSVKRGATASSIGLFAGSDIIADQQAACPLTVQAAMFATSGSLMLPEQFRTLYTYPGSRTVCGNSITFSGSLSAHYGPYLVKHTISGGVVTSTDAGYTGRTYDYDEALISAPPPFIPLTRPWQRDTWSEVNKSCFNETETTVALTGVLCA